MYIYNCYYLNDVDTQHTSEIFVSLTITSEEVEILLDCLNDPFEVIKETAYKILMTLTVDYLALTVILSYFKF